MHIKQFALKSLCCAALLCAAAAAQAGITTYTSQAAFLAAVQAPGVDTFDDLVGPQPEPDDQLNRTAGGYTYDVYSYGGLFGADGGPGDSWLSNNFLTSPIVFSNFSGGVRAFGGNFFAIDAMGAYTVGNVVLTAIDGGVLTYELNDAATTDFLGFVSSTPLAAMTLSPGFGFDYPSANNVVLAVPEPATCGMLLAGLGIVGAVARRRSGAI
jgi:hypothetical protein